MVNYQKAKKEFSQKLSEFKKETHPSIYSGELNEIVLYQKLLELQEQIDWIKNKIVK